VNPRSVRAGTIGAAGTVRSPPGPASASARLAIAGLAGPVEATWQLSAP
jgi:hypothetical protein